MADGITVHLGGRLGVLFGEKWEGLHVSSPEEAFRAIDVNTGGGFRRYLANNRDSEYHICLNKAAEETCLAAEELTSRTGKSNIYVLPAIKGRNSGWAKIIAGAILIVVGALIIYGTFGGGTPLGVALISLGASLIFGGITQLLTSVPQQQQQLQSYDFQGNAASVAQGGCVPVIYGRYLVSPLPICISFSAQNSATFQGTINQHGSTMSMGAPVSQGGVVPNTNDNGTIQYSSTNGQMNVPTPPGFNPYQPQPGQFQMVDF